MYMRHVKKLYAFMMRHLWSIMKIKWQDKVTNIKVIKWAGLPSMEDLLIRKNLRILIPTRRNLCHYSEMYGASRDTIKCTGNEGSLCRMRPPAMMIYVN